MALNARPNDTTPAETTRMLLKRTARHLFAEQGIKSVGVRDIAEAANQKNRGAVAYYFGTKSALVQEIFSDGARRVDAARIAILDEKKAKTKKLSLFDAVDAIVRPLIEFPEQDPANGSQFNRFLFQVSLNEKELLHSLDHTQWNDGYNACVKVIRKHLRGLNRATQNRRIVFMGLYVSSLLAHRETLDGDADDMQTKSLTSSKYEEIVTTAESILTAKVP